MLPTVKDMEQSVREGVPGGARGPIVHRRPKTCIVESELLNDLIIIDMHRLLLVREWGRRNASAICETAYRPSSHNLREASRSANKLKTIRAYTFACFGFKLQPNVIVSIEIL